MFIIQFCVFFWFRNGAKIVAAADDQQTRIIRKWKQSVTSNEMAYYLLAKYWLKMSIFPFFISFWSTNTVPSFSFSSDTKWKENKREFAREDNA